MIEKLKSGLIVVGIIAGGFIISGVLTALRAEPPRAERTAQIPLVETVDAVASSGALRVAGTGTVRPTREITLAAEVGGRIVAVSPRLVSGGAFRAGDILATVEPQDYRNALAVAEAEVVQRQFDVLRAEEEVAIARDEWSRSQVGGRSTQPDSTILGRLAFREPERELARAGLRAAEARVADARLRLERTRIRAPFSGLVRAKQVDLGQFVAPGQPVASVYGSDELEISVSMSARQMNLIDADWQITGDVPATVTAVSGDQNLSWEGYVHRIEGALDPATRQASVVVRVRRPFAGDGPPLLVGSFVDVSIEGRSLPRFWDLPRGAVHQDGEGASSIWTMEDEKLVVHPVEAVQQLDDRMIVRSDALPDSFALITSDLDVVTEGMTIRTLESR